MKQLIDEIKQRIEDWIRLQRFKREFEETFMPDKVANRELMILFFLILFTTFLVLYFLFNLNN